MCDGHSLSKFPVGLPVQLVSANEHSSSLLGRVEQQQISRDPLVLADLDYMADFQSLAGNRLIPGFGQDLMTFGIHLCISSVAKEVIGGFFKHRN